MRLEAALDRVIGLAAQKYPWVFDIALTQCSQAEQEHLDKWRQFAHTGHLKGKICLAPSAWKEFTPREALGVIAHELGHIIALHEGLPAHTSRAGREAEEAEANAVAAGLGMPVIYNARQIEEADGWGFV
jgi:predicted Zn-dependent protease